MSKDTSDFLLCPPYDSKNLESVLHHPCGYIQYDAKYIVAMKAGKPVCPKCNPTDAATVPAATTEQTKAIAPVVKQPKAVAPKQVAKAAPAATTPPVSTSDVDINGRGKFGYTFLHKAALAGDEAECDRLLALGAKKTAKDNGGKMPWQKVIDNEALAEKLKP